MDSADLKNKITYTFGKPVKSTQDCKDLSLEIYNSTNQLVSYNTLRRFFDIIKNVNTSISNSTLNILANYCGYKDFLSFCNQKYNIDIYELDDYILNILNSDSSIDIKVIGSFCTKYIEYQELYHFLEKLLLIAKDKSDLGFYKSFYSLPEIFDRTFNKKRIFQLSNIFSKCLNSFSEDEVNILLTYLSSNENGRNYFIESYVDIDNLNGYYGKLLDLYIQNNQCTSSKVFYCNLKILQSFLNWDRDNLLLYYSELKGLNYNTQKLHPILIGRSLASEVYFCAMTNQKLTNQFINQIVSEMDSLHQKRHNHLDNQLLANFIFQALHLTKAFDIIDLLYEKLKPLIDRRSDYWTDNIVNFFQIIDIHRQTKKDEVPISNETIKGINKNKFVQFEKNIQSFSFSFMLRDYYSLIDNDKAGEYDFVLKKLAAECNYKFAKEMGIIM